MHLSGEPAPNSNSITHITQPKSPTKRFTVILESPTSLPPRKLEQEQLQTFQEFLKVPMTYLNRQQSYNITIEDCSPLETRSVTVLASSPYMKH